MDLGLSLIFYYGLLHALSPDHLIAISNFSIGLDKKKTLFNILLFALGHGSMLFLLALLLQKINISDALMGYGDKISAVIISFMGLYFLLMVATNKVHLRKHFHNNIEHIHIWFGAEHKHNNKKIATSTLTMGALMGIGGVRGMLVTLGAVQGGNVNLTLILSFSLGVMLVFIIFGFIILYINQNLLNNKKNIKRIFTIMGIVSVLIGINILTT